MTTVANVPALIVADYEPGMRNTFFEYNSILKAFPPSPANSGDSLDWSLGTDGTDNAATASEGGSLPSPNTDVNINLTIAKQPFNVVALITHEVMNYANREGIDPWAWSIDRQTKYLSSLVNTTLQATWEAAIASGASYAGQTRASYSTALVSYVEATAAALSYDYLATMMRTLMDASRGVAYEDLRIYMSPTLLFRSGKIFNYSVDVAKTTTRAQGAQVDGGLVYSATGQVPTFEGVPIIPMIGMTSSTVIMGPGGAADEIKICETQGPKIWPLGKVARDERALIDCDYQIRVKQPALWGKLTSKS